jgi:hypothetical protein
MLVNKFEIKYKASVKKDWSNYGESKPIDDLREWQTRVALDTGYYPETIEFGTDVANSIMKSKNNYGLEFISDLPDMLFGENAQLKLSTESSKGIVTLRIGKFNNTFLSVLVL